MAATSASHWAWRLSRASLDEAWTVGGGLPSPPVGLLCGGSRGEYGRASKAGQDAHRDEAGPAAPRHVESHSAGPRVTAEQRTSLIAGPALLGDREIL